jgi:hypothetical protein
MFTNLLAPAIILIVIGLSIRKTKPVTAKRLYIAAVIYLIIAGGLCAMLMHSLKDLDFPRHGRRR